MARTCTCGYPVWGTDKNTGIGYCQRHQFFRTDKKKARKELGIKKMKITTVCDSIKTSFGFDDQISMFQALWEQAQDEKGIVTCPYTGERLNCFYNTELWYSCFAHVLPKGRYTYWKLNPDNIRIVHPDFHKCVDQGTTEIRKQWTGWKFAEWDALVIQMKQEYIAFKKKHLLA